MKKILALSMVLIAACLFTAFASAQDWNVPPVVIDASGDYSIDVDTVKASYELAKTAEDSAKVDSCLDHLAVVELNADNVTLDGNGNLIYGPGVPGDFSDVQGVWPNRIYADTTALQNITVRNVNITQCKTAIYLTKVGNSLVENCTLTDVEKGIYPNSKQDTLAANCVVQNNTITNVDKLGIDHRGPGHQCLNNVITQTRNASSGSSAGIVVSRTRQEFTKGVLVQGNTVNGGGFLQYGIRLDRSSTNTYEDNDVTDVVQYGVYFSGSGDNDHSDENTLTNTTLTWTGANDAAGVYFNLANNNVFDNLTMDPPKIGIKATNNSVDNVIKNSTITSDSLDVDLSGGSTLTLIDTPVDLSKVAVADTSELTVKWNPDIYVVTNAGTAVKNAIVVIKDGGTEILSDTLESGKMTPELTAYIVTAAGADSSDLSITASANRTSVTSDITLMDDEIVVNLDISDWVPVVYINKAGTYTVDVDTIKASYDLADSSVVENCIDEASVVELNASDVTLEGNGSLIYGPGEPGDFSDVQGVWPNRDYSTTPALQNITVRNINITQCKAAIYLTKVGNSLVEGCTLTDVEKGIYPNSKQDTLAANCVVQNNTITNVDKLGIDHRGPGHQCLNNVITQTRNASSGSSAGIVVSRTRQEFTKGVLVQGNTVNGNGFLAYGIRLDRSSTNTYEDNKVTDVVQYGVYFSGSGDNDHSDENTLTNTTLTWTGANDAAGVYFNLANNNVFDNLTMDPPKIGIKARNNSVDNVIKNSKITSDSLDVDLSGGSTLKLLDTKVDPNKIAVADSSELTVNWTPDILLVTNAGTTVKNAVVVIKDGAAEISRDTLDVGKMTPELTAYVATAAGIDSADLSLEATINGTTETADIALFADKVVVTFASVANWVPVVYIDQAGTYTIDVDTIKAHYDLADSAVVEDCLDALEVVELNANDVTLEGNGSLIYGPGEPGEFYDVQGVWPNRKYATNPALQNITVRNVNITQCKTAIYLTKVGNSLVEGCTLTDVEKGIYPNSKQDTLAANCVVRNNTITNVDKLGIDHRGPGHQCLNNVITQTRNASSGSSAGIVVSRTRQEFTKGVLVKGNTINGNGFLAYGIRLDRSAMNTYMDNTVKDASTYGIYFSGVLKNNDLSAANILTNTTLSWTGVNEAVGVLYNVAPLNVFNNLSVDGANIGIHAKGGSEDNLIVDSEIKNCDSLDVVVEGGSGILISNSTVDTSKVVVLDSSFLAIGWHLDVIVTGSGPIAGATVKITNPLLPDEIREGVTDADGKANFNVPEYVILALGVLPTSYYNVTVSGEGIQTKTVSTVVTGNTELPITVVTGIEENYKTGIPDQFTLEQNYPNPFNPETHIYYQLPKSCNVTMNIYNIHGQLVRTLIDEMQTAGYKSVVWDAKDSFGSGVSSGLYFYMLKAGEFKEIKRMTFLK